MAAIFILTLAVSIAACMATLMVVMKAENIGSISVLTVLKAWGAMTLVACVLTLLSTLARVSQ